MFQKPVLILPPGPAPTVGSSAFTVETVAHTYDLKCSLIETFQKPPPFEVHVDQVVHIAGTCVKVGNEYGGDVRIQQYQAAGFAGFVTRPNQRILIRENPQGGIENFLKDFTVR
jgi:hypothetical protein